MTSSSILNSTSSNTSVEEKFSSYYEAWLLQLEAHLQHLVLGHQPNFDVVVASLTSHHKDYYTAKWAAAHEDILYFFSPQWLSPLESAFSWFTGWKPSMVFRLVDSLRRTRAPLTSLSQLSDEQAQRISVLRVKIKSEEGKVEREMERQQVALGDRNMVQLARVASRADRGAVHESGRVGEMLGGAVKGVVDKLEKVMKMADYVRLKTLKDVLDVLSPRQGVDLLAMFAMLQIQMRKVGKQRAADVIVN